MEKRKLIDSDLALSPRDEKEAVGQFTRGQTLSATKLGAVGAGLVPAYLYRDLGHPQSGHSQGVPLQNLSEFANTMLENAAIPTNTSTD